MKDRELPKTPSRTPTIREVATRAGVSPATVSNTLSGLRGVTGIGDGPSSKLSPRSATPPITLRRV